MSQFGLKICERGLPGRSPDLSCGFRSYSKLSSSVQCFWFGPSEYAMFVHLADNRLLLSAVLTVVCPPKCPRILVVVSSISEPSEAGAAHQSMPESTLSDSPSRSLSVPATIPEFPSYFFGMTSKFPAEPPSTKRRSSYSDQSSTNASKLLNKPVAPWRIRVQSFPSMVHGATDGTPKNVLL